jgi:hypothetical protein
MRELREMMMRPDRDGGVGVAEDATGGDEALACQGLGDFDADHHKPETQRSSPARAPACLSLSSSSAARHASYGSSRIPIIVYTLDSRLYADQQPTPASLLPSLQHPPTVHSMGICSSCLGGRRTSESDVSPHIACTTVPSSTDAPLQQSDASHLLGDPYQPNYGTANSAHNVPQPDPEELRRQRENLERICAETNE